MRNKFLSRIIVVILLCAFLTMSVGRVTRVSAVGTTAVAIAGTATLAVGIVFLSYCALTGMATHCPDTMEGVRQWCTDIGNKVKQYPSGLDAYNEIYEGMYEHATGGTALLDDIWDWTREKLIAFANDFTNIDTISNIVSFEAYQDTYWMSANGFDYSDVIVYPQYIAGDGANDTFAYYESIGFTFNAVTGPKIIRSVDNGYTFTNLFEDVEVRNYLTPDGYMAQKLVDGEWVGLGSYAYDSYTITRNGSTYYLQPKSNRLWYELGTNSGYITVYGNPVYPRPFFPDAAIYDSVNDVYLPMDIPSDQVIERPHWPDVLDPDDEVEYPIIPYTELPLDRYGGGGTPNPKWGFNFEDLLDILGELGRVIFDIQVLKELLNDVGGQSSGDSYIYYDYSENGTTYNNFEYYNTSNFYNDYVTYNIDVSEVDEHLPVDLNTIQSYTNNRYIDSFKRSAIAGGSILRDLVVFWYDVDPEIVYVIFGTCILTLVAAFIGKWGHS